MNVILLERIESLGQMGEIVNVKPGYARNYLLPFKKALRATKENMTYFEKQRAQLEAQNLTRRGDAEGVAAKMAGLSVVIIRQAGESGQLYGSVSTRDIAVAVTAAGFGVERRQILLDQPIKALGIVKTRVALHPEVILDVAVNVAQSEEAAALQAAGKAPAAAPEAEAADVAAAAPAAPSADGAEPAPKAKKAAKKKAAPAESTEETKASEPKKKAKAKSKAKDDAD
ncbi:MAG: 50S ribosomal protein L9 [Proteobacteria bacterium]|nr:50S ribosomal protein L9 [Pseudomonadota bacterium]